MPSLDSKQKINSFICEDCGITVSLNQDGSAECFCCGKFYSQKEAAEQISLGSTSIIDKRKELISLLSNLQVNGKADRSNVHKTDDEQKIKDVLFLLNQLTGNVQADQSNDRSTESEQKKEDRISHLHQLKGKVKADQSNGRSTDDEQKKNDDAFDGSERPDVDSFRKKYKVFEDNDVDADSSAPDRDKYDDSRALGLDADFSGFGRDKYDDSSNHKIIYDDSASKTKNKSGDSIKGPSSFSLFLENAFSFILKIAVLLLFLWGAYHFFDIAGFILNLLP